MRKLLTEAMIEKLGAPESGRLEIFDKIVPGLAVRVTANGSKTFVVRGRVKGQTSPIRVTIGDATAVKVAAARTEATDLLKACRVGEDPRIARREKKEAEARSENLLWERVVADFIEKHAKANNRTWKQTEATFARCVTPRWKGRLITEITRTDVVALLDQLGEGSVYQANRVLAAVRKLFNWAVLRDLVPASPIVAGMAREGEKVRDRFLTFDEIAIVWRAAERVGQPFGPLVKLLLVTGQRRGEVANARWSSLDLDKDRLWTMTPEETKAGRAHLVPLTELAVAILTGQPKIAPPPPKDGKGKPPANDAAIFAFTTTGNSGVSGFAKAKAQLDAEIIKILREDAVALGRDPAKVEPFPGWRIHDLRRTAATHMEDALGVPPHLVGSVLNHSPTGYKGVTAVYTRGDLIYARRRALVAWSRLLRLIVAGGPAWLTVAQILRPETEADAARTDELRRTIQADETAWTAYLKQVGTTDQQRAA